MDITKIKDLLEKCKSPILEARSEARGELHDYISKNYQNIEKYLILENTPWGLRDTVAKLVEAADVLLLKTDYDGHGWEFIKAARDSAEQFVKNFDESSQQTKITIPVSQEWLNQMIEKEGDQCVDAGILHPDAPRKQGEG